MKIELGQKNDPAMCAPMSKEEGDKLHYPSLYFTHDKPVEVPKEGTAVITFRRVETSENDRDPDDPKYRCEIEVRDIEFKGGKPSGDLSSKLKEGLRKKLKVGEYEMEEE